MKRILKYVMIIVFMYMLLPFKVSACGGLMTAYKEAVITNDGGASVYDNTGKATGEVLAKGTVIKVEVTNTYNSDNSLSNYYIGEDNGTLKKVKVTDYEYNDKDLEYGNGDKFETSKYYVYADTELRSVPSFNKYEVVATIPAGTEIEISTNKQWGYVTYNGVKGWTYLGTIGCNGDHKLRDKVTVTEKYDDPIDAYTYYDINYGYKVIGDYSTKKEVNIKANSKVKLLYKQGVGEYFQYIQTDDGEGVWIGTFDYPNDEVLLYVDFSKNIVLNSARDFGTYDDAGIDYNKVYPLKYKSINKDFSSTTFYDYGIIVDGQLKWVTLEEGSYFILEEETVDLKLNRDYDYYGYPYPKNAKSLGKISKGDYQGYKYLSDIELKHSYYYVSGYGFIKYDGETSRDVSRVDIDSNNNKLNLPGVFYLELGIIGVVLVVIVIVIIKRHSKKEAK